ncbi:MAG: guanylate kinase [Oscillospiraceae bacterium]|nr:guanylate kinase [Oscillospiraceae bacterium]
MSKGHLIVISGSSGVGKSTVLKQVIAARNDLQFSVSATSRPARPGEINGVQYYFVSREAFQQMIEEGAFVEYDYHMDNYYGTLKSEIINKTRDGNLVLDVEPVGAMRVREIYPEATLIYIAPPSLETLEQRIRMRNDTPEEQIKIRRERAAWEHAQKEKYDYVVINDVVEDCVAEVLHIISSLLDQ